ncbi:MAG TPA: long-chain fatty acid--CoA ligase [Marmoricola sp.]|nr:long-chain fatty acid--CoA ligase [Marmoricola sp.]
MTSPTIQQSQPTGYPEPALSLARLFLDRIAATPDAEAFRYPTEAGWPSVTWAEVDDTVRTMAAGLLALGIEPEDRVAVISTTRIEWIYADLAIMCAGAATTGIYPTTVPDDVGYIVADSGSRIAFAEDDEQIGKLRGQRDHLPDLLRVITFAGESDGEWVLSLDDLQALGARHLVDHPTAVDEAAAAVQPDQLATILYTSGTTGRPKGVELPHSCWTYVGAAAQAIDILQPDDLQYLWLPLAHSFGKMLVAVQLQIGFATAVDGRVDKIVENMPVVRPTFMAGPPRIFEKVHGKIVQTIEEEGGLRAQLFRWAFGVGDRVAQARLNGRRPDPFTLAQHALADRLVLAKIRDRLGGRIRYMLSGSAALSKDVSSWFYAAGLLLLEGYGLTETSAATSVVRPSDPAIGVVGLALPGTEVRIADDGEVLQRGPSVMRGYHNLPEMTAEVLDKDGWFATGDLGEFDEVGRLRITDRKKDLMKTSGGKYIAPQPIEVMFKAICPLVSQILVHADNRNYATALVALDPDALDQWGRAHGLELDYPSLVQQPLVIDYIRECVDELNGRLNRWETVKDFRLLDHDLSVEAGEVTPSLKVKRKVIESRYHDVLDSMYSR